MYRLTRILLWAKKVRPGKLAHNPRQEDSLGNSLLCRSGYSQEDDQLLRQDTERRDRQGREHRLPPERTGALAAQYAKALDGGDGSDAVHRLDLRPAESRRSAGDGGRSFHAEGHLRLQEEERPGGRAQDRRPAALRSAPRKLYGAAGGPRTAADSALSQSAGTANGADEEPHCRVSDGDRKRVRQPPPARQEILRAAAGPAGGRNPGFGDSSAEAEPRRSGRAEPHGPPAHSRPAETATAERAGETADQHWRYRKHRRLELGSGNWRAGSLPHPRAGHQLLRPVQCANQFGRPGISRTHFQTVQPPSAVGA